MTMDEVDEPVESLTRMIRPWTPVIAVIATIFTLTLFAGGFLLGRYKYPKPTLSPSEVAQQHCERAVQLAATLDVQRSIIMRQQAAAVRGENLYLSSEYSWSNSHMSENVSDYNAALAELRAEAALAGESCTAFTASKALPREYITE